MCSACLAERFFSLVAEAASAASLAGHARWWFLRAPLLPQGRSQYAQLSVRCGLQPGCIGLPPGGRAWHGSGRTWKPPRH